jgi:hypothetical protein
MAVAVSISSSDISIQESCPNFQSSLDISVTGVAQVNSEFGYVCDIFHLSQLLISILGTTSK